MTDKKQLIVSRVIDVPADVLFDTLTLPQRHQSIDGSGMIVSDEKSQRIQAVGDRFVMNMNHESQGGDYKTENHAIAFVPNKVVGWEVAPVGGEPLGWSWVWTLEPNSPDSTEVTLTYDWSKLEDKQMLAHMPAVKRAQLEESLNLLAASVG